MTPPPPPPSPLCSKRHTVVVVEEEVTPRPSPVPVTEQLAHPPRLSSTVATAAAAALRLVGHPRPSKRRLRWRRRGRPVLEDKRRSGAEARRRMG